MKQLDEKLTPNIQRDVANSYSFDYFENHNRPAVLIFDRIRSKLKTQMKMK